MSNLNTNTAKAKAGVLSPALAKLRSSNKKSSPKNKELSKFLRAENEDDDGYDPYSDRPAPKQALFEEDPWA